MPRAAALLLCQLVALLAPPASSQAGCFPAYSNGASYSSGDVVSKATTVTSSSTVPCATPGSNGCDISGFQTTTTTTTTSYNYRCTQGLFSAYCSNGAYAPGSVHGSLAWVRESSECVGVAVTDAPSPSPTPEKWSGEGCPGGYTAGTEYQADDVVSADLATHRMVYKCKGKLNSYCGALGYAPPEGPHWKYAWEEMGSCSGTIEPTRSPVYVSMADMGGCPEAWTPADASAGPVDLYYEGGDRVSAGGLVFECREWPQSAYCGQALYEPLSNADVGPSDPLWMSAWIVLGYCDGTIEPTTSPSFDPDNSMGGCPDVWAPGDQDTFVEGDVVSLPSVNADKTLVYVCKAWPYNRYCGQFSPTEYGGEQGWDLAGWCDGTQTPTSSPAFSVIPPAVPEGCPEPYDLARVDYEADDLVSYELSSEPPRSVVFRCRPWPNNQYCNQAGFAPGSDLQRWAWELLGSCEGTLAPTDAPAPYSGTCEYDKVTCILDNCLCSEPDCPNPGNLADTSTSCTKELCTTVAWPVETWSDDATYVQGDVVRVGDQRFRCRDYPYSLWCTWETYMPSRDPGETVWTGAWTMDGTCPP